MTWLRRLSLRARLLLVSVVVLSVGLAGGGVVLALTMNFTLHRTANTEALDTAEAVAELVNSQTLPEPVPAAPSVRVQVVDAQAHVLAVSVGADRLVPILYERELAGLHNGEGRFIPGSRIGFEGRVWVVALAAGPTDAPVKVLVARPTGDLTQIVHLLGT